MMFRYGQVEAALAKLHGVDEEGMGAFKGVIIHLQRLGIVAASPGRGKRIDYRLEDVLKWAFCLELLEFGLDPKVISGYLAVLWWNIEEEFSHLDASAVDRYFVFWPSVLSNRIAYETCRPGGIAHNFVNASQLKKTDALDGLNLKMQRRAAVINMSRLKRELVAALATAD